MPILVAEDKSDTWFLITSVHPSFDHTICFTLRFVKFVERFLIWTSKVEEINYFAGVKVSLLDPSEVTAFLILEGPKMLPFNSN